MSTAQSGVDQPRRTLRSRVLLLWLMLVTLAYEAALLLVPALRDYRLPIPYAVPIFDMPFVFVGIGVGYLCLERHRVRQDFGSAALGASLWLAALLAAAHILAQPDYPISPGVDAGIAPYFFFLSYLSALAGIGLATYYGGRPMPMSDRARVQTGIGVFVLSLVIVMVVIAIKPLLPSMVMKPGRLTPFAVWAAAVTYGCVGVFLLLGRKRSLAREGDLVAKFYLVAGFIWLLGLLGFLTHPYRYAVSWYLGGFARPIGVAVVFVSLLREQVWLYAELRQNLQRLKETQAQLIQASKMTALGTLVSGVAHELNNPLTTISLSAQLLQRQTDVVPQIRDRVDAISHECGRASRIIRDMLTFARRQETERRRIDLNGVVKATLSRQARALELDNIRIVKALEPALPPVWADSPQLEQVLLNLYSNAAHAMKSTHGRGVLTVRTTRRGEEVNVEITDNGPGIPAEHLANIFDPFFTTKPTGEGTGLGLSLALGIITEHGGRLTAANVPGSGARFVISLPLGEQGDVAASAAPEIPSSVQEARVLIVDDEENLRRILCDVLSGSGHRVDEAATAREAIAKIEQHDYDFIALDLRLPDMHGSAVWRRILERSRETASRVVFITGDTMSPEAQKFLEEAGRPVLRKPFTVDMIQTTIAQVLSQPPVSEIEPSSSDACGVLVHTS
jgi:signal transduction histidine kinase/ActR/RegA family two-component response regulator